MPTLVPEIWSSTACTIRNRKKKSRRHRLYGSVFRNEGPTTAKSPCYHESVRESEQSHHQLAEGRDLGQEFRTFHPQVIREVNCFWGKLIWGVNSILRINWS